ncbi:MAG: hypothetical protein ACHQWU_10260 [Gemmatimonadales bacterium]
MTRPTASLLLVPLALFVARVAMPPASNSIAPNDNRHAAGTLAGGVLTVALEVRPGTWHPEGDGGRGIDVAAFAEVGHSLTTPGPLIRVRVGTEVRATIHNTLDEPLTVFGFGKTRGLSDSLVVAPRATTHPPIIARAPGTV